MGSIFDGAKYKVRDSDHGQAPKVRQVPLNYTRFWNISVYAAMTHIVFSICCSCPNSFRPCLFVLLPVFLILFCIITIFARDVANCYIVYMNDNIQGCESSIANQAESVDFNKLLFRDKYIWSVRRPG